jgi:hypothetical protein
MKSLLVSLLAGTMVAAAPATQTFTGTVTDDTCAQGGHAQMRMAPTDAECARACAFTHGSTLVLQDGKNVYILSDQKAAEEFAAQKVTVVGTLDAKTNTIRVESLSAAK